MMEKRFEIREQHGDFPFVLFLLGVFETETICDVQDELGDAFQSTKNRNTFVSKDNLPVWLRPLEGEPRKLNETEFTSGQEADGTA